MCLLIKLKKGNLRESSLELEDSKGSSEHAIYTDFVLHITVATRHRSDTRATWIPHSFVAHIRRYCINTTRVICILQTRSCRSALCVRDKMTFTLRLPMTSIASITTILYVVFLRKLIKCVLSSI